MSQHLWTPHGALQLPTFLPDATRGMVRSVDPIDLERCGIQALVMNVFHLMQRPGTSTIRALGGLHGFSGWNGPIVTDSGGFQAYSLIRENPRYGQLTDRGIQFTPEGASRKFQLSPEKSIQLQLAYGADIVVCLDDCTHPEADLSIQQESVARTVAWAKRCKREFVRIVEQKHLTPEQCPRIFGVVQGGNSPELRQACAEELLAIEFDGFGFGGWPMDHSGALLLDIIGYTRELIPSVFVMHALGVGHPDHVVQCARLGYQLFDCALPTRDARRGRLFTTSDEDEYRYVYIQDRKHIKSKIPVEENCDCLCCTRFSRGYLYHLFQLKDALAYRLATIHNLRFMARLMRSLNQANKVDRTSE